MITLALVVLGAISGPYPVRVIDCHDGDTCRIDFTQETIFGNELTFTQQNLRFCLINAPEMNGTTVEAAKASRDALLTWIRSATRLVVVFALKDGRAHRDSFGRWIGYLIADGVLLNQKMIEEKLAVPYPTKECVP